VHNPCPTHRQRRGGRTGAAIASSSDTVTAWNASFRYDSVPLTVTNTTPPDGARILLPFTNLTVRFNEPVLAASIDPSDLVTSSGMVQEATLSAPDIVDFTLTNLSVEGAFTFAILVDDSGSLALFATDFEAGLDGLVISNGFGSGNGLWHLSTGRQGDPGHSSTQSLYFGQGEGASGGGTYDTGDATGGAVYSPLITLPTNAVITLRFNYLLDTEDTPSTEFDIAEVAADDGSGYVTLLTTGTTSLPETGTWKPISADLSSFAGNQIRLRFSFDTLDDFGNNFEGWYIDDVAIDVAEPAGDWYSVVQDAGESLTVLLQRLSGTNATVALYDSSGALATSSVTGTANVHQLIDAYPVSLTGTNFIRVTGVQDDYGDQLGQRESSQRHGHRPPGPGMRSHHHQPRPRRRPGKK
jgi:hypothetical protein